MVFVERRFLFLLAFYWWKRTPSQLQHLNVGHSAVTTWSLQGLGRERVPSPVFDSFTFTQNLTGVIVGLSDSIAEWVLQSIRYSVSMFWMVSFFTRWRKLVMRGPMKKYVFLLQQMGLMLPNGWIMSCQKFCLEICNVASAKNSRHLNFNWWIASGGIEWDWVRAN